MKYKDVFSFLYDVKRTKNIYKYTCGNDFETIKYISTNENGNDIYLFSQIEPDFYEPYFSDYIFDYELIQILVTQRIVRDYHNATVVM